MVFEILKKGVKIVIILTHMFDFFILLHPL